jgi:hypothetical protein
MWVLLESRINPFCGVIKEIFCHIGEIARRNAAIRAGRYSRRCALYNNEIFVRAIRVQVIDLDFLDQILKGSLIRRGKQRD